MIGPCPDCPVTDGPCLARRLNARRLCEVPEYRSLIERMGAEGELPAREATPEPAPAADGLANCRRRSGKWSCGGGTIWYCSLGLGQAGIIEPESDCRGCGRAEG